MNEVGYEVASQITITRPQWVALGEAISDGRFKMGAGHQAYNRRKLFDVLVRNGLLDMFGRPTLAGRAAHAATPPKVRSGRTGRNLGCRAWTSSVPSAKRQRRSHRPRLLHRQTASVTSPISVPVACLAEH